MRTKKNPTSRKLAAITSTLKLTISYIHLDLNTSINTFVYHELVNDVTRKIDAPIPSLSLSNDALKKAKQWLRSTHCEVFLYKKYNNTVSNNGLEMPLSDWWHRVKNGQSLESNVTFFKKNCYSQNIFGETMMSLNKEEKKPGSGPIRKPELERACGPNFRLHGGTTGRVLLWRGADVEESVVPRQGGQIHFSAMT